jgi:hypothetical protein
MKNTVPIDSLQFQKRIWRMVTAPALYAGMGHAGGHLHDQNMTTQSN